MSGGGTIDANGNIAQIGMPFVGEGAMTFKGGSTITLAAANTYTGGTTIELGSYAAKGVTIVSNGTLKASARGSGNYCHSVRVVSGATFDINGSSVSFALTLEEGTYFVNNGTDIPNNYQQVNMITLEGNATVTANGNLNSRGDSPCGFTPHCAI